MRNSADILRDEDALYMGCARAVAKQSGDRSTKVGCVIVDHRGTIRAAGCNDLPPGVAETEERRSRPGKYLWTVHSERKAIFNAARNGVALKDCRIYVPWFPCTLCVQAIVEAGIVEVIGIKPDLTDPQWGEDFAVASQMLAEGKVAVRFVEQTAVKQRS